MNDRHDALAARLAQARTDGTTLAAPGFDVSLEDAYTIQERVSEHLGSRSVGWKVGSTSVEAQARLGTDEPGAGRLLERFVYGNGATVPIARAHHAQVEVEFAFRIGRELEARDAPYGAAEVRAATDRFLPAMEIVGSRYEAGLTGSGRSLVTADGGANIAFAAGDERPLPDGLDLAGHRCALHANGEVEAEGEGARALGDPINVLVWLANHLSSRGLGLEAGALVSTGTCTGLVAVNPGDRLRGDFGLLGSVEVTLEEMMPSVA